MSFSDIPPKMKALVLEAPGKYSVRWVDTPKPGPYEVLVRVRAVAICGSDPLLLTGKFAGGKYPLFYPMIPGHEWAGEIVALGPGVTEFKIGDRVAGEAHKGCGLCNMCKKGRYNLCENFGNMEKGHRWYGFIANGAYAQYQVYHVKAIHKIPDTMSFEEGAMVDTTAIALHGLKRAGVPPGGTVVIIGPGPVGLCALQCAKALGAGRVIVVGRGHGGRSNRMKVARELGGELVDVEIEDPVSRVLELTNGKGADLVVECSGSEEACSWTVNMVRKGGSIVLIGNYKKPVNYLMSKVVFDEITIYGSRGNPNASDEAINLIASGKINVKKLITHVFPLDEFAKALETFVKRLEGAIKVIVKP
ncbi:MAG: alcohol dehydrogenase [Thermoprotei archaeon]|nr:MAG: alcohol dehydrogenase [Thermoprotei archaeon]